MGGRAELASGLRGGTSHTLNDDPAEFQQSCLSLAVMELFLGGQPVECGSLGAVYICILLS